MAQTKCKNFIDLTSTYSDNGLRLHHIKSNLPKTNLNNTLFMEFGVYSGRSMEVFHDLYKDSGMSFYGFDSWQGLPYETQDQNNPSYWYPGSFSGSIEPHIKQKFDQDDNVHIVDGWFEHTLNDDFYDSLKDKKIGIVHIDCDIYSSTKTVLEWLCKHNMLQKDSLIVYDDWGGYMSTLGEGHEFDVGEGKAHKEVFEKYGMDPEFLYYYLVGDHYRVAVFKV